MRLVVGLGNPGPRYAHNRHNIGFMALDAIARRWRLPSARHKFSAEIAEGEAGGARILTLAPQGFMNLSGQPVGEALRFLKLEPDRVIVIHDELDLEPGRLRVKFAGGAGGHNGLRSLDQHIGKDYWRVRLGIGHPGDKALVNPYVLGDFAKADATWREPLLAAVAEHLPVLLAGDAPEFQNRVTLATRPAPTLEPGADS